jgi:hypothetical protein
MERTVIATLGKFGNNGLNPRISGGTHERKIIGNPAVDASLLPDRRAGLHD